VIHRKYAMRNPEDLGIGEVLGLRDCQAVLDRQLSEGYTLCSLVGLGIEAGLAADVSKRLACAILADPGGCIPRLVVQTLASENRVDVVF
jgi:hypothetical protein